ncbi:uncharacterized protein LOC113366219 [Ctenocephalides felis]|uniref:uncharacterized protein LOC113366219 n=1 Tax=Ctenocephalides felis TaxID=7515 RepID=UPI000E6E1A2D|nr:uncharacterized protein LOC113366219 [Ctenocephalides felis]
MHKSLSFAGQSLKSLATVGQKATKNVVTGQFGSTVAVHKLRESRWFNADECRLLCSVLETGFIVEVVDKEKTSKWYGVALWKSGKGVAGKSQDPDHLFIYTLTENLRAVRKLSLHEIWNDGNEIRINNLGDKETKVHTEKDIRDQVKYAKSTKRLNWHNTKHFSLWCRHGDRPKDLRKKQVSECIMWGSMNASFVIINNQRQRSISANK